MLTHTDKNLGEKLEGMLKSFDEHPLVKKIKNDEITQTLVCRKEAAEKIEVLKKERDEIIPKLRADLAGKEAKCLEGKAALDILLDECRAARATLSSENLNFDASIREEEKVLLETAAPALEEAIQWFRDRHEKLLLKKPNLQTRKVESNIFTMMKNFVVFSNVPAIQKGLAICRACIRELEGMKLAPVTDTVRIDQMRGLICDTDALEEFSTERPFGRVNTDWRNQFKSDDQLAWEMKRLDEEHKKIMKRKF